MPTSAIIVQGDRSIEVLCQIDVDDSGPQIAWSGSYWDADPADEPDPGVAELRLRDGSSAAMIVNQTWAGTGRGLFLGTGDPPGRTG